MNNIGQSISRKLNFYLKKIIKNIRDEIFDYLNLYSCVLLEFITLETIY